MKLTETQAKAVAHTKGSLQLIACAGSGKTEVFRFLKYEVLNEVQQALFVDRHSKQSGLTATAHLNDRTLQRHKDADLHGFNAPIHEALGYGKSLHDGLHEVHSRAIQGDAPKAAEVPRLVDRHLHTPYAYPALRDKLEESARRIMGDYLQDNQHLFDKIEFCEKAIEINLGDGVTVNARIDLVRRVDTGKTAIVDLKSNDRAQPEEVTETQLHIYALGYQELTGRNADFVAIYDLDGRKRKPRSVDDEFIDDVKEKVRAAAGALRKGAFDTKPAAKKCAGCDYRKMCGTGLRAT